MHSSSGAFPPASARPWRTARSATPQLAERGYYRTASHDELGEHRFEGLPMQFSDARWRMDRGAPLLGEDNERVLTGLLGYSAEELAGLAAEAAI